MSVSKVDEISRLEKRIDDGLASLRRESQADFRFLVYVIVAILVTMAISLAGLASQLG